MWNDLKFAVRQLRHNSGFAAVAILMLALGIGSNTAVFSIINAVILKPLPFAEPERVMTLWERDIARGIEKDAVTPPNFDLWEKQNRSFESLGYWTAFEANLVLAEGVQKVRRAHASSGVFSALRVRPLLGRVFGVEEDQPEGPRSAIISHSFWRNQLGGRHDVVGRTVTIDTYGRREYTIVGVMPPEFTFPDKTELWLSAGWNGIPRNRHGHWLNVIGRLRPGVALEQASAEMNTIQSAIAASNPGALLGKTVSIVPLLQQTLGPRLRPALLLIWGVVGGVMLIACANVANLLLVRAIARQKEMSLRAALGASRARIIRQLLAESATLALAGGLAGAALGWWTLQLLLAVSPGNLPRLDEVSFDMRTLAFTFAISAATGILFGLAPAWQFSRPDLDRALRGASHSVSSGLAVFRLRGFLVCSEIAISLLLLSGAVRMIQAFAQLIREDRGFQSAQVITADLDFSVSGYTTWIRPTETRPQIRIKQLMDRLETQPGVEVVAAASNLPRRNSGPPNQPFYVEGQPAGKPHTADYTGISPHYFDALRIPLLRGRAFTEDDRLEAPQVLIINETLAKRCFPGQDPIGKRLSMSRNPAIPDTAELSKWPMVVGVVADVKTLGVTPETHLQVYVPYWQWPMLTPTAIVRAKGDSAALAGMLRKEISAAIPNIPEPKIMTLDSILGEVVAQPRFQTWLLVVFGILAALLAAIGLYGMLAYTVAQRRREIGVRVALGAQRSDVMGLILQQGLKLVALGTAVGLAAAAALARLMNQALYGAQPAYFVSFAGSAAILFGVAFLASMIPARRAASIQPMDALRCD